MHESLHAHIQGCKINILIVVVFRFNCHLICLFVRNCQEEKLKELKLIKSTVFPFLSVKAGMGECLASQCHLRE